MARHIIKVIIPLIIIPFLINCTSSSNKHEIIKINEQEAIKNINISTIAPGQVALQATVLDINKFESRTIINILVEKVLEYGSTTPPVANGSNLKVFVNDSELTAQIHDNELITVVIRHIRLGPGEEHEVNWQILRFK